MSSQKESVIDALKLELGIMVCRIVLRFTCKANRLLLHTIMLLFISIIDYNGYNEKLRHVVNFDLSIIST